MTALPNPTIRVYFDLPQTGGDFFTIEHATRGQLDDGSPLAGDAGTVIDADAFEVSVNRGRQRDLDPFDAGEAQVRLHNLDRTYDPTHEMSGGYVDFPGVAGNALSTPDAAEFDITGDITLVARAAFDDWTPAGFSVIVGKREGDGSNSYRLANNVGNLSLVTSPNGTDASQILADSTAQPTVSNGDWLWVAATLDVNNGAGGRSTRFWTSDDGVAWSQLGSTVTVGATTSIFSSSADVEIGAAANGTENVWAGSVSNVSIRNGIGPSGTVGGTEVFQLEPEDFPADTASAFTSTSGHTVTVSRSGSPDTEIFPLTAPYSGSLSPGKRCTIEIYNQTIYSGFIVDWNNVWSPDGLAVAEFAAVDGLGQLARKEYDEWVATAGQTAGQRLTDALNRGEVNFGVQREFDDGVSTLMGDLVTWGSNVLNYLQLVALSDYGRFFDDRNDVLRFHDRSHHFGAIPVVTFTDDGTGVNFHGVTTEIGSELLFNRVGVDREDGILQTVEDEDSQNEYGISSLMLPGLLMDSDSQANDLASYLVSTFNVPRVRISSVSVNLSGLPEEDRATVAALDISDVVRVVWTPRRVGAPIDQTLIVEGVSHQMAAGQPHIMTLNTSVLVQSLVFTIEDATLGRLDTGAGLAL